MNFIKWFIFASIFISLGVSSVSYPVSSDSVPNMIGWERIYGVGDVKCVQTTFDGGYILVGANYLDEVFIIKSDSSGLLQWQRRLKNDLYQDLLWSVKETGDRSYILCGTGGDNDSNYSYGSLIKLDFQGNVVWENRYGNDLADLQLRSVIECSDGRYVAVGLYNGYRWSQSYLVKTGSNGQMLWEKVLPDNTALTAVVQTFDGGFVASGSIREVDSEGNMLSDAILVKFDPFGNVEWQSIVGGDGDDCANTVLEVGHSGYIMSGYTYSFGAGSSDIYLVKVNEFGILQWQRSFGGSSEDYAFSMSQGNDGGLLLCGYTYSYSEHQEGYIVKTNAQGDLRWMRSFGEGQNINVFNSVDSVDYGYVLSGCSDGYAWCVKILDRSDGRLSIRFSWIA